MKCLKKLLPILFILNSLILKAQDTASAATATQPVNTTQIDMEEPGAWYTMPWVWLVAAAFFTFLLVLLLRSGRTKKTARQQTAADTSKAPHENQAAP